MSCARRRDYTGIAWTATACEFVSKRKLRDERRHQTRRKTAFRGSAFGAVAAHQRPQDRAMDHRLCRARLWRAARRYAHQRSLRLAARGGAHLHAAAVFGAAGGDDPFLVSRRARESSSLGAGTDDNLHSARVWLTVLL